MKGHSEILEYLLNSTYNVYNKKKKTLERIDIKERLRKCLDIDLNTPFHLAVLKGNTECINLVSERLDHHIYNDRGWLPLEMNRR